MKVKSDEDTQFNGMTDKMPDRKHLPGARFMKQTENDLICLSVYFMVKFVMIEIRDMDSDMRSDEFCMTFAILTTRASIVSPL